MDLVTVTDVRTPSSRAELSFAPGERPMGGGTWLYSEAQPGLTGLVDLTSLGWSSLDETPDGVTVGATCTIAELTRLRASCTSCSRMRPRTAHRSASLTSGDDQSTAVVSTEPNFSCASSSIAGSVQLGA